VGYKCGDRVKQKTNVVAARVLRRYVWSGERRYDLKDELGCVARGVGEGELWDGYWIIGEGDMNAKMQEEIVEGLGEEMRSEMDWCVS
jgi:hypothetical protein